MKIVAAFDPVTRIEGHLNVHITIDTVGGSQQVVDAQAKGMLFRGFENLLVGRDPRDAQHITQRICGVCPVAHGMAAVRGLDAAFGVSIPPNGRILRNLVAAANFLDSHILHFYLLSLPDFIEGLPGPPWQADWEVDRRFSKDETEQLRANYLRAIAVRRRAHEMGALFGGRMPHPVAFIPGGFTATPRPERIAACKEVARELVAFIENAYLKDVRLVASRYSDYFEVGRGHANLMAYGVFDLDDRGERKLIPGGYAPAGAKAPQALDLRAIGEHVARSWFASDAESEHPASGQTRAQNPKEGAYSWLKAPRLAGAPVEVGPLARMWVRGNYTRGVSAMDRHLARAEEALLIARSLEGWADALDPAGAVYAAPSLPKAATSRGLTEAPRGALGHWFDIREGKIARYQIITPTTWNLSPRDAAGVPGPLEQALIGTPVQNADEPIEVMRVIHSFDPCLDCAAHVMRPGQKARVVHSGFRI